MTKTLTLDVPTDVLASLRLGVNDLGAYMRLAAAISYFQEKKLSLGKAAELAGINRLDFMDLLESRGIVAFDYDENMAKVEIAGAEKIKKLLS